MERSRKLDHCIEFHASYQDAAHRAVRQRYDVAVVAEHMREQGVGESCVVLYLRSHELLCEARATLQWSYAYSYYEEDATQGELFGIARTGLVKATERLGEHLEQDWKGKVRPHAVPCALSLPARRHAHHHVQGAELAQESRARAAALDKALASMRRYAEDQARFAELAHKDMEKVLVHDLGATSAAGSGSMVRSNSRTRATLGALRRTATLRRRSNDRGAKVAAASRAGRAEGDQAAGDAEEEEAEEEQPWPCAVCTFMNEDTQARQCAMCEMPRA